MIIRKTKETRNDLKYLVKERLGGQTHQALFLRLDTFHELRDVVLVSNLCQHTEYSLVCATCSELKANIKTCHYFYICVDGVLQN